MQINRWGGDINTWNNNVQSIRDFINQRCLIVEQGLSDCFGVTGPYSVVFKVEPDGAGDIDINANNISVFPHTRSFYGSINNSLKANANQGYEFSHWQLSNNTLTPNNFENQVSVNFNSPDTIIAHFTQIIEPTKPNLKVFVNPPNSGEVILNNLEFIYDSFNEDFDLNSAISLKANNRFNYVFSHWDISSNNLNPNNESENVSFILLDDETVIANFVAQESGVYVPNALSPNGDGDNDFFYYCNIKKYY